ncbi:uncharacterized protein LOC142235453 isoform X2 [Haematobia irritans]|uniref:uncharacterized protein LOC142235453 isoform X2 n=1 Tax=Haematobia irritans TaxID=7368 RepID=UPI003F5015ED
MFKFIVAAIVLLTVSLAWAGDIQGAAETVDVPPEHRAAPPQHAAQPPPPGQFPGQPAFFPRAAFPRPPVGGVGPLFPPLFFQTQSAYVPFASTYSGYRVNHVVV